MIKPKVLFICGSPNQTLQMHKISIHLSEYDCYFTPYYASGFLYYLTKTGILDFTIMGGEFKRKALEYFNKNNLQIDIEGKNNNYDIVFTCQDLIIPKNIIKSKIILIQEGMTDPETLWYRIVRTFHLPRWAASTSMTGLSDAYDIFCVASDGYKELFISKGIKPFKIRVTGIPNFDDYNELLKSDFPNKDFVLVATSDMRETYKYENRKEFIKKAVEIAGSKQLIFKLHPNEKIKRAVKEINKYAPSALIYYNIPIEPLIAKCDILITRYSSVVYKAIVLGKKVISDIPENELLKLLPEQNGGKSAFNIAAEAKLLLESGYNAEVYSYNNYEHRFLGIIQKIKSKLKPLKAKNF